MIYLGYIKETDTRAKVTLTHFMPLDPEHGLGKTEDELKVEGLLIDALPNENPQVGKISVLYCDPTTSNVWYEYQDIPLTLDQQNAKTFQGQIKTLSDSIDFLLGV